tara:strand:+ start:15017 stop:15475 length:459 start_codon:yes stop_codon:yes gene_type:complete
MNNKPILFFSRNDTNSKEIWSYIKSKNLLEEFIKISTDNNRKIPSIIKSTPSIYIKGRPVITDMFIKMYIDTMSSSNNAIVNSSQNLNPQRDYKPRDIPHQSAPEVKTSTNNLNGIKDFNPVEMGSNFSDNYSFIENDTPMSFCYQFLDEKE